MDSSDIEIHHTNEGTHGEYLATASSCDGKGKLSWTDRGGVRHAEHTFVPPACRGKGMAEALVKAMIADAREHGFRIAPDCSYVARYFDRHAELAELRA